MVAAAAAVVVGLLLELIGFGLRLPFLILLVVAAVVARWFLGTVLDPAPTDVTPVPEPGVVAPVNRNLDRRVRVLETRLWGVQPAHGMNRTEVARTIADLTERRRQVSGHEGPLPTVLAEYLSTEPPPALSRRRMRTILQELNRL
ncbi:hypothetical protein SAMN04489747_2967 [Auraticoccus monumenti]|uniref:Uncharacterized protein n=1 Tax=Auraticoccus monumenti TaxID=675864 RepID=A0A1G7BHX9_9ACTN|nr:hypothetical protein SAMN04489747_2967 [Auraticoccus monumenti]